jgi:hypothetical protein
MTSPEATEAIIGAMVGPESDTIKHWNIAIQGAVASNNCQALERLLQRYDVDAEYAGPDGWTPLYTARKCESGRVEEFLRELSGVRSSLDPLSLQRPSRWHPEDKHPGIAIGAESPTTLATVGK